MTAPMEQLMGSVGEVELTYTLDTTAAIKPTRATPGSIGLDLYSPYQCMIPPVDKVIINTHVRFGIPMGYYGRLASRSGPAASHSIVVEGGVIDQDYRGDIYVILFNLGSKPYKVLKGQRIAQFILERAAIPDLRCVGTLPATLRGQHGTGATGGVAAVAPIWPHPDVTQCIPNIGPKLQH